MGTLEHMGTFFTVIIIIFLGFIKGAEMLRCYGLEIQVFLSTRERIGESRSENKHFIFK
jgi:hypothetical protein